MPINPLKCPWKWSESGDDLLDCDGNVILRVKPSDATERQFTAIVLAAEMVDVLTQMFVEALGPAGVFDVTNRRAARLLNMVERGETSEGE